MKLFDKYIPQFVYGAFDGIVTTFAVVAAAAAAGLASEVVLIFGLANLLADGFSMGASAFLSHQAEHKRTSKRYSPTRMSLVTFFAFLLVGFIPVAPYFIDVVGHFNFDRAVMFPVSIVITALTFVWVGYMKSIHYKKSLVSSMFETFLLGAVAATLAYVVGAVLKSVFGA